MSLLRTPQDFLNSKQHILATVYVGLTKEFYSISAVHLNFVEFSGRILHGALISFFQYSITEKLSFFPELLHHK